MYDFHNSFFIFLVYPSLSFNFLLSIFILLINYDTSQCQQPQDVDRNMEVINDPDWVNAGQAARLGAPPVIRQENGIVLRLAPEDVNRPIRTNNNPFNNREIVRPYSFEVVTQGDKLEIKVMGIWKEVVVMRKRLHDMRVKFDGELGRSIEIGENDTNFTPDFIRFKV